ncbi:MAG: tetratricopeptide repeat protein [Candidatus Zixiibacteriota bacterium]
MMSNKSLIYAFAALAILLMAILAGCGENSGDTEQMKQQGLRALDAGDYNKAINIFREALKAKPSDRDLLYNLALSYKKFDIYDSAYAYFRRARVLNVRDREINREIVEMAPAFGDYRDAINAIAVMVATGDNEKIYWPRLAELYYRDNDMSMAARYCRLIIADDPDQKDFYLYLSQALSQMGKFEESNETLKEALKEFGPSSEAYASIAFNYLAIDSLDAAVDYLRKSVEVNPDNATNWVKLGIVMAEKDDRSAKEEALGILKKYRDQAPPVFKLDSLIPALEARLGQ